MPSKLSAPSTLGEDFSGNWCNQDAVASSLLESVSLVTPLLEKFFVRSVAEAIAQLHDDELKARCLAFIREESQHSRMHQQLNARLHAYLGERSAGMRLLESLLNQSNRRLSLPTRLLLTTVLEHFSAIFSKTYVHLSGPLNIEYEFARNLFFMHAQEELAHCAVVFDLLSRHRKTRQIERLIMLLACAGTGVLYLGISVPWILHRKTGRRLTTTIWLLLRSLLSRQLYQQFFAALPGLFSFVRRDFHPTDLTDLPTSAHP
jgi:predicted metal-dependent hydrolase